jgi:hypothetical protein
VIHSIDPRQNRLFDPFEGVIPPAGRKIISNGWQGVVRHVILEVMPVGELAKHFSDSLGAPTKELYSSSVTAQSGDGIGFALPDESTLALVQPRCKLLGHGF